MPRKPYKIYGITTHRKPITPELMETEEGRVFLQQALSPPKIDELLNDIEQQAIKILKDYQLYDDLSEHYHKSANELPEMAYHALDTLKHLGRVRYWVQAQNAAMAATETIHMMLVVQNANILFFEPDIYRGKEQLKAASSGGKVKRSLFAPTISKWQRRARELWAEHPDASTLHIAQMIADADGGSVETIRRKIKKP